MSTSSPFWMGQSTGLKAYRPSVFGNLPRSGLPEYFGSAEEWQHMLEQLAQTGLCDDPTKIWWDLRPSARFHTLEMRVCDVCTRLEDAIAIAALYQAILATLYRLRSQNQTWRRYRPTLVEENKWLAQRYGIHGELADFGALARKPFAELAEELELTGIELGFLPERRQALLNLNRRTNLAAIRGVVNTLLQTEKYGTPLSQSLRVLANEFRDQRLLRAEEKAARLPATLTVPMIVFILPVLFIVLIGPAIISVMDNLL